MQSELSLTSLVSLSKECLSIYEGRSTLPSIISEIHSSIHECSAHLRLAQKNADADVEADGELTNIMSDIKEDILQLKASIIVYEKKMSSRSPALRFLPGTNTPLHPCTSVCMCACAYMCVYVCVVLKPVLVPFAPAVAIYFSMVSMLTCTLRQ